MYSWRDANDDFDKGDLKDELGASGFEDCVIDSIADRVEDKAGDNWNHGQAREAAVKEIEMFIHSTQEAYNTFKKNVGPMRKVRTTM